MSAVVELVTDREEKLAGILDKMFRLQRSSNRILKDEENFFK